MTQHRGQRGGLVAAGADAGADAASGMEFASAAGVTAVAAPGAVRRDAVRGRLRRLVQHDALSGWGEYRALALVTLLAVLLRWAAYPGIPAGVNQDEADAAYDAYALLMHGTDKWGNRYPVYLPSWGSGQNALLSYLDLPVLKLFGLNAFSIRLVPDLLATLSVPLFYFVLRALYDQRTALLGTLTLAIVPWHMMLSRWALESDLLPFCLLLGVGLFLLATTERASERSAARWLPFAFLPFALALYAYGIAVVVVFPLLFLLLLTSRRILLRHWVATLVGLAAFALLATPFLLFLLVNYVWHAEPAALTSLPFTVPLLLANRSSQVSAGNLTLPYNLLFFATGFYDGLPWSMLPGFLPLGLTIPPLALFGFDISLHTRPLAKQVLPIWVVSTLPLLFLTPLNVNRDNAIFLPLVGLSAVGVVGLVRRCKTPRWRRLIAVALVGSMVVYSAVFTYAYFTRENASISGPFHAGLGSALAEAARVSRPGELTYVSDQIVLNYVYVLYYGKIDPVDFQQHVRYVARDGVYEVHSFRTYRFQPTNPDLASAASYVYVLSRGKHLPCASPTTLWTSGQWVVGRCTNHP